MSWTTSTCCHRQRSPLRSRAQRGLGVRTPKAALLPGKCIDTLRGDSWQSCGRGLASAGLTPVPVPSPAGTNKPWRDTRCPPARSR